MSDNECEFKMYEDESTIFITSPITVYICEDCRKKFVENPVQQAFPQIPKIPKIKDLVDELINTEWY